MYFANAQTCFYLLDQPVCSEPNVSSLTTAAATTTTTKVSIKMHFKQSDKNSKDRCRSDRKFWHNKVDSNFFKWLQEISE